MSGGQPGITCDCRENEAAGTGVETQVQAMKIVRSMRDIASSPGTVALAAEVQERVAGGCGHAMELIKRGIKLTLTEGS